MANRGMIGKTYEIKVQGGHIKEAEPEQPEATSNNTTSNMQNEQVGTASQTPHQNEDIDKQLEATTPKHGGNS